MRECQAKGYFNFTSRGEQSDSVGTALEQRAYINIAVPRGRNSPCDFDLIHKIKEPIRDKRFATREDIANAVRQQMTRFKHRAANTDADGIQRLLHRWQRVVIVAGDDVEDL
ncbi:uncharacterized protein TNCV_3886201 [Trichonephila clavipes]|nr:uncharacterized protein TNCV_3886201 [Trichonephila clavipes]